MSPTMNQIAVVACFVWASAASASGPQFGPSKSRVACDRGVSSACVVETPADCSFDMGTEGSGEARVELRGSSVESVSVFTLFMFPGMSQTCSCTFDAARGEKGFTWEDETDGRVNIRIAADPFPEGDPEGVVTISPQGTGFWIDLRRTTLARWCGACAELPGRVFYAPGSLECAVEPWDAFFDRRPTAPARPAKRSAVGE